MTCGWMVVVVLLGLQPGMAAPGDHRAKLGDQGAKLQVHDGRDGAPAAVEVRNEVSKLKLTEASLLLDDKEVVHLRAAPGKDLGSSFRLWASGDALVNGSERVAIDGWLQPGNHAMTVALFYEGRNVGPFTYVDAYKTRVEQTYAFSLGEDQRPANFEVVAREEGGSRLTSDPTVTLKVVPEPGSGARPLSVPPSQSSPHP
jgi:hypothetical protein